MNPTIFEALVALNQDFYARFANAFAHTRRSWPPGFMHILPHLQSTANVLDLGCGNGRLLTFLTNQGWTGDYLGVDSSAGLLVEAKQAAATQPQVRASFVQADLLGEPWYDSVRAVGGGPALPALAWGAEAIACLAVLHHIPGAANRAQFLSQCRSLLAPNGRLILSTWQFMTSKRLRARVLPWEAAGLDDGDVEMGDYLVAWGQGAAGRRYCAFLDLDAVTALADKAGLVIGHTYYADGHEGKLNLYAVLTAR